MHARTSEPAAPRSRRRTYLLFWASYAVFILYVTTLPFDFVASTSRAADKLKHVSPHLFTGPDGARASFSDMVQNVVLFAPFGALTVAAFAASSASRRRSGMLVAAIVAAAVVGFGLSAIVETLQLFTVERVSSLNDVLTNSTGAMLGGLAAAVGLRLRERLDPTTRYARVLHEFYPVIVWGAVLVLATWHPFDTTIDVGSIGSKGKAFLRDPWQAGAFGDEGVDAVRYALFSASCVVCLQRLAVRRSRLLAALAGSALAAALEFSQFFVQSRMPGMKDVTVGVLGSCMAALVAVPRLWSRRRVAIVVGIASFLATALMTLSPLVLQQQRRPFQLFPLLSYASEQPERAISHAAELSLAFFPIGFALACVLPQRRLFVRVVLVSLALGGLLEYLQGWVVGRYPDVTDAVVMSLGALAGAWAASNVLTDYEA